MPGLELVHLDSSEADAYFRVFVVSRSDLPNPDPVVHLDRYLAMAPEDQRTFHAFKDSGRIIGTARLVGNEISFFSLLPEERRWTRDAILQAVEPIIASGGEKIVANFEEAYAPDFTKLGFEERFSRMRMEAAISKRDASVVPMSHPEAMDVDEVLAFLMAVYDGHFEQQFGIHTGTPQEWRDYVTGIWKGDSGTYLPLASWATRDKTGLTGASFITHWMGMPLVAELGVRKDHRGEGLGRALLMASMNSLADLNHNRLALYVTVGNDPAISLYKRVGFEAVNRGVTAVREL